MDRSKELRGSVHLAQKKKKNMKTHDLGLPKLGRRIAGACAASTVCAGDMDAFISQRDPTEWFLLTSAASLLKCKELNLIQKL